MRGWICLFTHALRWRYFKYFSWRSVDVDALFWIGWISFVKCNNLFLGNSLSAILEGEARLTFLNRGEDYVMTMPYAHCKGKCFHTYIRCFLAFCFVFVVNKCMWMAFVLFGIDMFVWKPWSTVTWEYGCLRTISVVNSFTHNRSIYFCDTSIVRNLVVIMGFPCIYLLCKFCN